MRPTHSGTLLVAALLGPSTLLTAAGDPVDGAMANIRPEALRAHMRLLADDLLEGRAPGTRQLLPERAAALVGPG